jgi:transketolase
MDGTAVGSEQQALIGRLRRQAADKRVTVLQMVHRAGIGHAAGDLSCMDILSVLYGTVLRVDPSRADWPDRDRFILSKGHCTGALYTTLAQVGFIPEERLLTYMQPEGLNGHPDRKSTRGVETNTGPLGHGLPVAVGTAIAAKLQRAAWRTFVVTGDGELQEGSNWEAAMCAGHRGLENLTVIVDRNRLQQGAPTEETNRLDPLDDKWRAFGFAVREVDGHDYAALIELFGRLPFEPGKPNCVIANTHKGQGVSFMRDHAGWHHRVPTDEELEKALKELEEQAR